MFKTYIALGCLLASLSGIVFAQEVVASTHMETLSGENINPKIGVIKGTPYLVVSKIQNPNNSSIQYPYYVKVSYGTFQSVNAKVNGNVQAVLLKVDSPAVSQTFEIPPQGVLEVQALVETKGL